LTKILSRSGDSLADLYDVKGSIAGVDQLISEEVHLTHEMGAVLFSERLSSRMLILSSGSIAQNITFAVPFSVGQFTARLLGVQVLTDNTSRISHCQLSINSPPGGDDTDVPFWYWDTANDDARSISILVNGTLATTALLNPLTMIPQVPNLVIGTDAPLASGSVIFRGVTTGFGAGTVLLRALVSIAFPQQGGLSSRGLPLPGW